MTTMARTALYLTDNGALLCRDHLGATARYTGRDISGQRIHRLTDAERDYMVRECGRCECATCYAIAHPYGHPCPTCGDDDARGSGAVCPDCDR